MYSVIIVDDHKIFRDGLKLLLHKIKDVRVIGEASSGKQFLDILDTVTPDLIFMDINMPDLNGIETTSAALKKIPGLKIIGLSSFGDSDTLNKMIYAGVEGFMLKNAAIEDFKKAIPRVINGGNFFSDELLLTLTKSVIKEKTQTNFIDKHDKISERELELLQLICSGYSNEKIGEELNMSSRSVERYKTILISKTGTMNTVNLVIYAFRNKLVM